jgi:hypothetical protein
MAKKRYVGFKHEHIDEIEPTFDAKGIETVRRDGFPAGQKMVETCIKSVRGPLYGESVQADTLSVTECCFARKTFQRSRTMFKRNGRNSERAKCLFKILPWQRKSSWDPTGTSGPAM